MICHLRDEAHRFGITFHRQKRSNAFIHSELEDIKGIGEKSVAALLKRFRSVARIRKASRSELVEVVGESRADAIISAFAGKQAE